MREAIEKRQRDRLALLVRQTPDRRLNLFCLERLDRLFVWIVVFAQ